MMSTIQLSSSITMSPPEPIIKGTHFRQNIWGKGRFRKRRPFFFMLKCGFVKLMKLLILLIMQLSIMVISICIIPI